MQFSIARNTLVDTVRLAASVLPARSADPHGRLVRLTANGAQLLVDAIAPSVQVTAVANNVTATAPGHTAAPPDALYDLAQRMPDAVLMVRVEGDRLVVKAVGNRRQFQVPTVPVEELPRPRPVNTEAQLTTYGNVLAAALRATIPAASEDWSRAALHGVLLDVGAGASRMPAFVATNGKLFAAGRVPGLEGSGEITAIIHYAAARFLAATLDQVGKVTFASDANGLHFVSDEVQVVVPHVVADFPDWQRITAMTNGQGRTRFTVPKLALAGALRAMGAATWDHVHLRASPVIGVELDTADQKTKVEDALDVPVEGPPARVQIGCRELLSLVQVCDASEIQIAMGGELDPVVLTSPDGAFFGIAMPMEYR
jgi:DNA polymerase III sliding clamp (beta) subunit (PCNA family)